MRKPGCEHLLKARETGMPNASRLRLRLQVIGLIDFNGAAEV
jgi:hypothetical protein